MRWPLNSGMRVGRKVGLPRLGSPQTLKYCIAVGQRRYWALPS